MVENDATPGRAFREQQGQPKKDIVSERTLRRWLNHFKWWGETPRATQKRATGGKFVKFWMHDGGIWGELAIFA